MRVSSVTPSHTNNSVNVGTCTNKNDDNDWTKNDDDDAVNAVAALTRALDTQQVDVAVHYLELLLLRKRTREQAASEGHGHGRAPSRLRRLETLEKALKQMRCNSHVYTDRGHETGEGGGGGLLLRRGGVRQTFATVPCELSYLQLQLFAVQKLQPCSTAYNVVRALRFSDVPLDLDSLRRTCSALMTKHDVLRTCFDVDTNAGGQASQVVYPISYFQGQFDVLKIVQCDLLADDGSRATDDDMELAAFVAETVDEPFELAHQAPIRVFAFTCADRQLTSPWILAVVLHHIVTDAASSQLFWRDFHYFYAQFSHCKDGEITTPSFVQQTEENAVNATCLTYLDFAEWQRARLRSGVIAPLLQYWMQQLTDGGVPALLELPFDAIQSDELDRRTIDKVDALDATTAKGDIVVFQSSPSLQKAFSELCHAQGASMFMGLLAVFYLLIERLSGQQDFVIGAPFSGRDSTELQDVMGYFVNTVPLRLGPGCRDSEGFKSFLASVRKIVLEAYTHSEVPFYKILEHLRACSRGDDERRWQHPLFQTMFSWEQVDTCPDPVGCVEMVLPHQTAKFDLMLSMRYGHLEEGSPDRVLEGVMEYSTAKFTRDTVQRFTSYYLRLLEQVTISPNIPVRSPSISMLSDLERKQLVLKWGMPEPSTTNGVSKMPAFEFLDECLFDQVQKTPLNTALHFEGTQWTYQDLWDYSGCIAKALCALDIPGNLTTDLHIGLLLDRGLEYVAAMVGILRLKATFVPLDLECPRKRLSVITRDSGLQVIITQRKHDEIATYVSATARDPENDNDFLPCILRYEDLDLVVSNPNGISTVHKRASDDKRLQTRSARDAQAATAYILYTSGSTGSPKGVMVPYAALMTTLWWTVRTYAVTASDVFLQSTSTCLDGSLSQLFSPLLVGGSARITRPKGLHELHYMRHVLLDAPHVTFCVFVPSYFALLLDYLNGQGDSFPTSVKHVVLAGEAFPIELAHRFYRMHEKSATCLVNEYGPTEASITSTAFQLPRSLALQGSSSVLHGLQSIPIGKPIDDHPVIVLDLQKRLAPVNVPGELYVGGAGLARGYRHRPDLTENAFILHQDLGEVLPLEMECGRRWYKTGDLVKWLPSGDLVFLGRADAQVKHHGMRIEPQEVRNVLLRHEGVKAVEVLVLSQARPSGSKQQQTSSVLVAFVMAVENISDSINEKRFSDKLRSYLHEHLPMHMVPKLIQVVRCWPRTPSGKVDLRKLANWANVHSSSTEATMQDADGGSGSTITVQLAIDILRQVWMQALGINSIYDTEEIDTDRHEKRLMSTSFFELGGDSLAAIRAIALARARGLPLAFEQFFRSSSLPEMARNAATSMTNLRELTSQTLVPLNWPSTKARSSLPTLFLFHDAVGTVWQLLELARQLPFAVVGIQASTPFSDDGTNSILETQPSSVEELAELYWNQIRERQSEGPYALGGFSFGCRLAYEVARLVIRHGHKILPLILLDGLPFVMPSIQLEANKVQDLTTRLRIDEYANEAFSDPFLRPLRVNFRKFCSLDQNYQPYTVAEVELASSKPAPPIWLHADLYMTQHSTADVAQYRQLGVSITIVSAIPDCTHLTMLRHPSVKVVARQIQQRASAAAHVDC